MGAALARHSPHAGDSRKPRNRDCRHSGRSPRTRARLAGAGTNGRRSIPAAGRRPLAGHGQFRSGHAFTGDLGYPACVARGSRVLGHIDTCGCRSRLDFRLLRRLDRCRDEPDVRRVPAHSRFLPGSVDRRAVRLGHHVHHARDRCNHLASLCPHHALAGAHAEGSHLRAGGSGSGSKPRSGPSPARHPERSCPDHHRRDAAHGPGGSHRSGSQLSRAGRPEYGQLGADDLRRSAPPEPGAVDVDLPGSRDAGPGCGAQLSRRRPEPDVESSASLPGVRRARRAAGARACLRRSGAGASRKCAASPGIRPSNVLPAR